MNKADFMTMGLIAGLAFFAACSGPEVEDPAVTEFAECIYDSGVRMYGSFTCSVCARQRDAFGPSMEALQEIECHPRGENPQTDLCLEIGVEHTPTFVMYDENNVELKRIWGFQSFEELAEFSGCPAPNT